VVDTDVRHGSKIGRFIVTGELGAGGMGVVYAAHDRELDRRVALKVLRAAAATDEERMRMLREGQAMARVTHPNVITVYEVGVEGSLVFLAQELLDAGTLGQWLERRHTQAEIVDKFVAAGRGLAAAHAAGLVHRDFKPDNVLLGKDGRVRVSDFGLARALEAGDDATAAATRANMARAQLELSRSPMSPLTRTGAVLGTPMYMAPEQHNGERADERSDQFSFSVALYHALYGDWPFAGKTAVALADAVIEGRLQPPPRDAKVPAWLRKIVLRGLATRREDRYPSMDALLADLTRPPKRRLRTVLIAATVLVLVGGAVVGGYALRTHDEELARPPLGAFDPKTLTNERSVEWFTAAVERDQLDDAVEKYDLAGALARQNAQAQQASVAASAGALVLALRGHLEPARAHLKDAEAQKGQDPLALAYVDLATAAIAATAGDLEPALARSDECAREFTGKVPELAAMCFQLHGDVVNDRGDRVLARKAYEQGRALVEHGESEPRLLAIKLALVELDLDDGGTLDTVIATATALQTTAETTLGPTSSVAARAAILLARAHVAQAATQQALADLEHIKPDTIQAFDLQVQARIARGQVFALLGDPDEGFKQLDAARGDAEAQGCLGLVLAARLGRVEVMSALASPGADQEQRALIGEARKHGFGRIAHLAETVAQR
jgi:predicted negative regulator of RcsB-dependent stress response